MQTLRLLEIWDILRAGGGLMEDKDPEKKSEEVSEKNEKEKLEEQKKQNTRLAERKGQRPAFPFKRKSF